MWYFTSPGGPDRCRTCSNLPSNSSNSWRGGLPSVLISTLRRPRWAMPITTSLTPCSPARRIGGVHQRDQRVAAFQREALLADVLGVQVALQAIGGGQALEDALLVVGGAAELAAGAFQALVHPATLFGVGDVHELGADRAGVGGLEQARAGRRSFMRVVAADAAGAELGVEVAVGQAVESQARGPALPASAIRPSGSRSAARWPRER